MICKPLPEAPVKRAISVGIFESTSRDRAAVLEVLASNQLSPGPKVEEFESRFALRHGCRMGVMTNSGTDALRIALATLKEAHGWKDGDIVLCPAVTFVATINVVLQLNLTPQLIDVGMYDFNMNAAALERTLRAPGQKIRAIIVAHLCGQPAEMDKIKELADHHGLKIIEDSCETMGVCYDGRPVGSWGDIGCFSFYIAHLLTTGVGGMAVTNNPDYAVLMRSFMNHGRDPFYIPGKKKPKLSLELLKARYRFQRLGYSCRPTEFEAALGLSQLDGLDRMISKRRRNAQHLIHLLDDLRIDPSITLPVEQYKREHAYMMFPIVLNEKSTVSKWDLCLYLEKNGIETRELLPIIGQPCYEKIFNFPMENNSQGGGYYSVANRINQKGFYIGCHQGLDGDDMEYVADKFKRYFQHH